MSPSRTGTVPRFQPASHLQTRQSRGNPVPARTPGPRPQRAPLVRPAARLALVGETNDTRGQTFAIVRLDARGNENRVTPAARQELAAPIGPGALKRRPLLRSESLLQGG